MSKLVDLLKSGKTLDYIFQDKSDNEIWSEISEDNFAAFHYAAGNGNLKMVERFIEISAKKSKEATVEMIRSENFRAIINAWLNTYSSTAQRIIEELSDETVKEKYPTLMDDIEKKLTEAISKKKAADEQLLKDLRILSKQTNEAYKKIFLALNDNPQDVSKAIELFVSWQDLVQKMRTKPGYSSHDPLSYQPGMYELNDYISNNGNDKINLFSAALKSRNLEFYRHLLKALPATAKYAEMSAAELELYAYAPNNSQAQINNQNEEKIICTLLALSGNSAALLHLIDKAIASKNVSLTKNAITAYQIATNNIDQTTKHYADISAASAAVSSSPLFLMKLARVYSRIHDIFEVKDVNPDSIQIGIVKSYITKNGLGGVRFDFLDSDIVDSTSLAGYFSSTIVDKLKTNQLFSKTDELFELIVLDLEKNKKPGKEPAYDMQYRFKESEDEGINVLVNKILRDEGIIGAKLPEQSVKPQETSKLDQQKGAGKDSSNDR